MTDSEFTAAQGRLAEVDTEVAAIDQSIRDVIDKSREFNDARRDLSRKRTAILKAAEPVRAAVQQHALELKKAANEKARAEAEARAKAEKNAPPQPTVADLMKTIEELKAKIDGKG
jgi:chromosome segregation ATPase